MERPSLTSDLDAVLDSADVANDNVVQTVQEDVLLRATNVVANPEVLDRIKRHEEAYGSMESTRKLETIRMQNRDRHRQKREALRSGNLELWVAQRVRERDRMREIRGGRDAAQLEANRLREKIRQRELREGRDAAQLEADRVKDKIRHRELQERRRVSATEQIEAENTKRRLEMRQWRESLNSEQLEANRLRSIAYLSQRRATRAEQQNSFDTGPSAGIQVTIPAGVRITFPEHLLSNRLIAELQVRNVFPQPTKQDSSDANLGGSKVRYKNVQCNFCSSVLHFPAVRSRHTLEIHGIKAMSQFPKFRCDKCEEVLNCRTDFVNHIRSHFDSQAEAENASFCYVYVCDSSDCYLQFIDKTDFKQHLSTHHHSEDISQSDSDSAPLYCQQCDKSFAVKLNYERHLNKIHNSANQNHKTKVLDCPFCWGIFTVNELRDHLEEHVLALSSSQELESTSSSVLCDECGKVFSDGNLLHKHRKVAHVHSFTRKYKKSLIWGCLVCSQKCESKVRLHVHYLRYHTYEHGTLCHVCDRRFKTLHTLNIHLKRHSGTPFLTNRFNCFYCTKVFCGVMMRNKHHVLAHSDKYLALRPFYCIACYANFETQEILDVHYETHLKWKCPFCSLHNFSLRAYTVHMNSHNTPGSKVGKVRRKLKESLDKQLMEVGDPIVEVVGDHKRETVRRLRQNPANYSALQKPKTRPDPTGDVTVMQTTLDTFEEEIPPVAEGVIETSDLEAKRIRRLRYQQLESDQTLFKGKSQSTEGISVIINQELEFYCKTCLKQLSTRDDVLLHYQSHVTDPSPEEGTVEADSGMNEDDIVSKYKNPNFIGLSSISKPIFRCNLCALNFELAEEIVAHRKEAHGIDPEQHVYTFKCHLCPRRFHENAYLQRHLKQIHPNNEETADEVTKDANSTRQANSVLDSNWSCSSTAPKVQYKWRKPYSNTPDAIRKRRARARLYEAARKEQLWQAEKERIISGSPTAFTDLAIFDDQSETEVVAPTLPVSETPTTSITRRPTVIGGDEEQLLLSRSMPPQQNVKKKKKIEWKCSYCSRYFMNQEYLLKHVETHSNAPSLGGPSETALVAPVLPISVLPKYSIENCRLPVKKIAVKLVKNHNSEGHEILTEGHKEITRDTEDCREVNSVSSAQRKWKKWSRLTRQRLREAAKKEHDYLAEKQRLITGSATSRTLLTNVKLIGDQSETGTVAPMLPNAAVPSTSTARRPTVIGGDEDVLLLSRSIPSQNCNSQRRRNIKNTEWKCSYCLRYFANQEQLLRHFQIVHMSIWNQPETASVVPALPVVSILPNDNIEDSGNADLLDTLPEDADDDIRDFDFVENPLPMSEVPIPKRWKTDAIRPVNLNEILLPNPASSAEESSPIFPEIFDMSEVDLGSVAAETKDGIAIIDSDEISQNGSSADEKPPQTIESNQSSTAKTVKNLSKNKSFSKMKQRVSKHLLSGITPNSKTRQMIKDLPFAFVMIVKLPPNLNKVNSDASHSIKSNQLKTAESRQRERSAKSAVNLLPEPAEQSNTKKTSNKPSSESRLSSNNVKETSDEPEILGRGARRRSTKLKQNAAEPLGESGEVVVKTIKSKNTVGSLKESASTSGEVERSTESEILWRSARARRLIKRKIQPQIEPEMESEENSEPEPEAETQNLDSDWQPSDDEKSVRRGRTSNRKSLSLSKPRTIKIYDSKSDVFDKNEPSETQTAYEETSFPLSCSDEEDSQSSSTDDEDEEKLSKRKQKSSPRRVIKKPRFPDDPEAATRWKCQQCNEAFPRRDDVRQHRQLVHAPDIPCDLCDLSFPDKWAMIEHQVEEHGGVHNQCAVESCHQIFTKREFLFGHFERTHRGNVAPYKCPECRYATPYLQEYSRHCERIHDMSRECSTAVFLKNFVNSELDVTSNYHCDFCNDVFVGSRTYNLHVRTHLASNSEVTAMETTGDTDSDAARSQPTATEDTGDRGLNLDVANSQPTATETTCGLDVASSEALTTEKSTDLATSSSQSQPTATEKTHDLDGVQLLLMYLCDFDGCDTFFRGADNLRRHVDEVHCPTGPFTCCACKRMFAQEQSLNLHAQNVHGKGLRECPYCNETFQTTAEAEKHHRLHVVDLSVFLVTDAAEQVSGRGNRGGGVRIDKRLKCPESGCSRACISELTLQAHIGRCHKGNRPKPFKCDVCDLRFIEGRGLYNHQFRYHGISGNGLSTLGKSYTVESTPMFHCDICSGVYKGKFRYNRHMRHHLELDESLRSTFPTVLTMYLCDYKDCNGMYRGKECLLQHFESHRSDTNACPFPCSSCDKVYAERSNLDRHVQELHKSAAFTPGQYECSFCQDVFQYKKILEKHEMLHKIDLNQPLMQCMCEICGKEFASIGLLGDHTRHNHRPRPNRVRKKSVRSKTRVYNTQVNCSYCGKSCNRQQLHIHMYKKHHDQFVIDNPFFCDLCFKPGMTSDAVKLHRLSHDKFKCKICDKQFLRSEYFKTHMRSHTGEKPFECTRCDKSFTTNLNLREHLRRHDKNYTVFCSICPNNSVGFYRKCHLEYHMETVHVKGVTKSRRGRPPGAKNKEKKKKESESEESEEQSGSESEVEWESGGEDDGSN